MTKSEMIGRLMHETGFNSNLEECIAFARARLIDEAGSHEIFRDWDSEVSDEFARQYVADRKWARQVFWNPLFRELDHRSEEGKSRRPM